MEFVPTTTIQIEVKIRDQLRARGRMGESYNDVIRRLLTATEGMAAAQGDPIPRPNPMYKPWVPQHERD